MAAWFSSRKTLAPQDAYVLWAASYPPRPHNALMEIEQAIVSQLIAARRPKRALDVGTGSGRYLPLLAATGARLVVGLDLSQPMLSQHADGLPRLCGDACRLPLRSASFDLVTASLMVGDVEHLDGWVGEVSRVVAPGGHVIYSDFHPSWAAERWRRTFRAADGRQRDVAYFPHEIAEHVDCLEREGFEIKVVREPRLATPRRVSTGSGRRDMPVVAIFHAVKGSGQALERRS